MPMARCKDCGRVLNSDGSCSSALECKKHNMRNTASGKLYCTSCRHFFEEETN